VDSDSSYLLLCSTGGGGSGLIAKDALGNDITVAGWLKTHPPGDRTLSQGLKVMTNVVKLL
jgi:cytochrome b6-f complex iron-sulfur subunit